MPFKSPEARADYMKLYYLKHVDKLLERSNERGRVYYQAHKQDKVTYQRSHRAQSRLNETTYGRKRYEFISSFKNAPCLDCKIKYPVYVMHFDHRVPSEKLFSIGTGVTTNLEKLKAEISKCDVVCANCHAERTHKQRLEGLL